VNKPLENSNQLEVQPTQIAPAQASDQLEQSEPRTELEETSRDKHCEDDDNKVFQNFEPIESFEPNHSFKSEMFLSKDYKEAFRALHD